MRDVVKSPKHPYAKGLMGSIPALDERPERLLQIEGAMPRLTAIPQGCAFHPRCPHVMPRCHEARPVLEAVGAGQVACFLHEVGQ